MSNQFVYAQVVDGLRLQAAPFAVQRRVLPDFVHLPDEVLNAVLTDYFLQLLADGSIPESARSLLETYEAFLDTCPLSESDEAALAELEGGNWFEELRRLARQVLAALGEDIAEPTLEGTTYVRGA